MAKRSDDLTRLKRNKTGIRFNDLDRILRRLGWTCQSSTGSHYVYSKSRCLPIMIVKPHGTKKHCHPMDVSKVIAELQAAQKTAKKSTVEEKQD